MTSRVVRRLASWIAIVALLAVTFMPTITSVLSAGFDRQDVCSADVASHPSTPDEGHHTLDHCPYCALHAALALPVQQPPAAQQVPVSFREQPDAFLQAPRATGVWATAQPRAPPAIA